MLRYLVTSAIPVLCLHPIFLNRHVNHLKFPQKYARRHDAPEITVFIRWFSTFRPSTLNCLLSFFFIKLLPCVHLCDFFAAH